MKRLFIGGVAHGRALEIPEEQMHVELPEDMFDPVEPRVPIAAFSERATSIQHYELRPYYLGPHIRRWVFVLSTIPCDEVLSKYSKLIFQ